MLLSLRTTLAPSDWHTPNTGRMDAMPSPMGAMVEGWVWKHKRGAKSGRFQRRYATYEMESGLFSYFTDESRSVPKGRATVLYAVPNNSTKSVTSGHGGVHTEQLAEPSEFTFRTVRQ